MRSSTAAISGGEKLYARWRKSTPCAGAPPAITSTQGVDFLHRAYSYFPPLIAAVLLLSYVLLVRAFRSLLLPLKAVLLNLLSVGAAYGMLVVVFKWGVGRGRCSACTSSARSRAGSRSSCSRCSSASRWTTRCSSSRACARRGTTGADNATAVAHGLERTGRIITAAAIIMCAAFSGFVAGRIVGLQQFGLGLAVAIFVDATIVRSLLVPSMMALFGRWNWWLPASARAARPRRALAARATARVLAGAGPSASGGAVASAAMKGLICAAGRRRGSRS